MTVCNELSLPWVDLQKSFLRKTTYNYDHAIFLNDTDYETDSIIIGKSKGIIGQQNQHLNGLKHLLEYSKSNHYDGYLILDSDCFPIKNNWYNALMKKTEYYDACCIIRTENCTTFPHPSAVFFRDPEAIKFSVSKHYDLRNLQIIDTSCQADKIFPLLRTNRYNPNLLAAGIYYNIFYHHGCGSRKFNMRTMPNGELQYYENIGEDPEKLQKELFNNPENFINKLIGIKND